MLVLIGQAIPPQEEEFAPQQADAVRASRGGAAGIIQAGRVAADLDGAAVHGPGGRGIPSRSADRRRNLGHQGRRRVQQERALIAVQQRGLSVLDAVHQPGDPDDGGEAERAGQDCRVRGRAALLGGEADHQFTVQAGRLRGRQVAGDQDGRLRRRRALGQAPQRTADLGDYVVHVRRPRLKDRIR